MGVGISTPSDAGRRSRRGFAYQDVVTLLDCLDLHGGCCDEVGFEDADDIVRVSGADTTYRQVKTSEGGNRHSIATVCKPDAKDTPATSILGRLFTGKPLDGGTRFCLTLNETPQRDLLSFVSSRDAVQPNPEQKYKNEIETRLAGLSLPNGFSVGWCVDRFHVLLEPRTIEQVEDAIISALEAPVAAILGQKPLMEELAEVLLHLKTVVVRDAMAVQARRWDTAFMQALMAAAVTKATGRAADGSVEPRERLASKLAAASVPSDEATAQTDLLLSYRRRYRSAVGAERRLFERLSDLVFATCSEISAQRRAGLVAPGAPAYAATVAAVMGADGVDGLDVARSDRLAALSDITARCRNRYEDDA